MPRKSWWARLPFGVRMTAGAGAVLMVIGGGTAAIAQLTKDEPRIIRQVGDGRPVAAGPAADAAPATTEADSDGPNTPVGEAEQAREPVADQRPGQEALPAAAPVQGKKSPDAPDGPGAPAAPAATRARAAAPAEAPPAVAAPPRVTSRTESERRAIPFRTRLVRDPALPRGAKRVQTPGVTGEELLRYEVTETDGRPTDRRLLDTQVTRQPQDRVVAFGTRRDDCGDDRCGPQWRRSECEKPTESAAADLGLTVDDLKELELEPGVLC